MIRHVVCFAWKDTTTTEQIDGFWELLAGLPHAIPELRAYHFGRDAGAAEGNFDFALVADFDDLAGWAAYQQHPAHRVAAEYVRPLVRQRVAVQFVTGM